MQDDWIVSAESPEDLRHAARESFSLFATAAWSPVLRALGATPTFVWSPSRQIGVQLAIFRRMGVRIGYLGFPVAGDLFDEMDDDTVALVVSQIQALARLPLLRVVRSGKATIHPDDTAAFPEARIKTLADWKPNDKRLRKDLAFARRSSGHLEIRAECVDPEACHTLYCKTVSARKGKARYTGEYFRCLAHLADHDERVRFFTATDTDGQVRGFSTVVRNHRTGYYLHGAVEAECRKTGLGDRLVHHMISGAFQMGCSRLSMMASPWGQPGLHAYKMKWGNSQRLMTTADHVHGFSGRMLRAVARLTARKARNRGQAWRSEV